MSNPPDLFCGHAPQTSRAFAQLPTALVADSALTSKEHHLAYLAVLCATRMTSGIAFHVTLARQAGATDEEIASACLVGLPAVGLQVLEGLRAVTEALQNEN